MGDEHLSLDNEVKQKLTPYFNSGAELKDTLLKTFGTYSKAGAVVGLSEERIHQIGSGYKVPKSPDIIKKLAEGWHIDVVVLTALFERLRI